MINIPLKDEIWYFWKKKTELSPRRTQRKQLILPLTFTDKKQ